MARDVKSVLMTKLADRLKTNDLIVAPGVYDGISARIADSLGFDAMYMTGFGVVASHLGLPDAGLASYTEMVGRLEVLAGTVTTPIIADADTGYGGLLNVRRTVQGYERAGAAAIQLEDQEFPKKCGHTLGRRVIPMAEMVQKIEVAVEARSSADTLIIARTDSRTAFGLDEALRRGEAYAKAGADVLFIESPESEAEMAKICATFDTPCLANIVEGGRTPVLGRARLAELGFRIAIFPVTGLLAASAALRAAYGELKGSGSGATPRDSFASFVELMDFQAVWDFEKRHATD